MLAKNTYDQTYIDRSRASIGALIDGYTPATVGGGEAAAAFGPAFTAHAVMALDTYFQHRGRGAEGKDGNALNEVRLIVRSLLENDGVMVADKTIRWKPESTVLGYAAGDTVALTVSDLQRLTDAFFVELQARFT